MDTFAVALIAFSIILISLLSRDWRKYNQNTPYTPTKIKRNILARIALGIKAGFHYLHFIETYDHKKYNTQVFTPKTLECYIGVLFAVIFWITYLSIA